MTQYTDTPQPTNQRNVSQSNLLDNNRYLLNVSSAPIVSGTLPVDHIMSGNNTMSPKDGFHQQVSMVALSATPSNLTNAVNAQASDSIDYGLKDAQGNSQLHHFTTLVPATPTYQDYQITPCLPMRVALNFSVGASPGFAITINSSFNVTSVTRGPVGKYTIKLINPLPSINYIYTLNGSLIASSSSSFQGSFSSGIFLNDNLPLQIANNNGTSVDPLTVCFMVFGG